MDLSQCGARIRASRMVLRDYPVALRGERLPTSALGGATTHDRSAVRNQRSTNPPAQSHVVARHPDRVRRLHHRAELARGRRRADGRPRDGRDPQPTDRARPRDRPAEPLMCCHGRSPSDDSNVPSRGRHAVLRVKQGLNRVTLSGWALFDPPCVSNVRPSRSDTPAAPAEADTTSNTTSRD